MSASFNLKKQSRIGTAPRTAPKPLQLKGLCLQGAGVVGSDRDFLWTAVPGSPARISRKCFSFRTSRVMVDLAPELLLGMRPNNISA